MQTGHLFRNDRAFPHYGAVVSQLQRSSQRELPPFIVLPSPIDNTGVGVSHGQTAGFLGAAHEPVVLRGQRRGDTLEISELEIRTGDTWESERLTYALDRTLVQTDLAAHPALAPLVTARARRAFHLGGESDKLKTRYGKSTFGQSCLLARRLVEHGVRLVTVNMFETVFNQVTWDCHADGGSLASDLNDYRDTLCPMFDQAYTALMDDLEQRGMLQNTMVLAMGEFGRTPHLNPRGGRDHWPGVWTTLFAGGPFRGGQVIGASDSIGAEPSDRPVTPAEIAATIYQGLGIHPRTTLSSDDGASVILSEAQPIAELCS